MKKVKFPFRTGKIRTEFSDNGMLYIIYEEERVKNKRKRIFSRWVCTGATSISEDKLPKKAKQILNKIRKGE
jgi:hypothetical protein